MNRIYLLINWSFSNSRPLKFRTLQRNTRLDAQSCGKQDADIDPQSKRETYRYHLSIEVYFKGAVVIALMRPLVFGIAKRNNKTGIFESAGKFTQGLTLRCFLLL